jgi:hypothetical protein
MTPLDIAIKAQEAREAKVDVTKMKTEDLIQMIMPSDRELEARSYTDDYSKLLVEVQNKDAFTSRRLTDAFRELKRRLPQDRPTMKLLTPPAWKTSARLFKAKLATMNFRQKFFDRLAEPDLRDEVIAALPDDCVEQCRNLQFDLYPRMLVRKLAATDVRS